MRHRIHSKHGGLDRRAAALLLSCAAVCAACTDESDPDEVTASAVEPVQSLGAAPKFALFESGQVRPLALSPDGHRLYALNTPDSRLEIFEILSSGLAHRGSVPVGLEPVALAARNDDEVWVVNHLSDSVSVVRVDPAFHGRVVRTLLVGDEPRDVVFAGPGKSRAFITTAHRGQNIPFDPQLQTPGVGRADVWVFDAQNLGPATSLAGAPLSVLTLFTDTPRALAASPDGSVVYAAGFHTGNRTGTVYEFFPNLGIPGLGDLDPRFINGVAQPTTGLIVKYNGQQWLDEIGRDWSSFMGFTLPDKDVFAIDAMASPPKQLGAPAVEYSGVGTILFNMIVNPASGKVYVTNTEAHNEVRFEGAPVSGLTTHSVMGHAHESRITVLGNGGAVAPRHLNKHVDYTQCCAPLPNDENAKSLAIPLDMAITQDGQTLYVAAFGSSKIGVYDTAALEDDTFQPDTANQVTVSGGGPSGVALDEARHRLYVMTRFDNGISIVDTATKQETEHVKLANPEPAFVVEGRPFLYDATLSSHGDSACASCHVFGDFDSLAWDLGNPNNTSQLNPNPFQFGLLRTLTGTTIDSAESEAAKFQPLKGPMTTQSLRGLANNGPMHWRGDRTGGVFGQPNAQPDTGAFNEEEGFKKFNVAFQSLVGAPEQLSDADMQKLADFTLHIMYPPNPIRSLDNSLTATQQTGRAHLDQPGGFATPTDPNVKCTTCHVIDREGNAQYPEVEFPGFFGTRGMSEYGTFDPVMTQAIKIPHFRNLYQKVGMFGNAFSPFGFMGDQVRGFGYFHEGGLESVFSIHSSPAFTKPQAPNGFEPGPAGDPLRHAVADFLLAMDSNLYPVVGQQITLARTSDPAAFGARIDLLEGQAALNRCELIAKSASLGRERGYLYDATLHHGAGGFYPDRHGLPPLTDAHLRALANATGGEVTFTCVPVGSGRRMGVDADLDGYLDGDELSAGSDPRDAHSTP